MTLFGFPQSIDPKLELQRGFLNSNRTTNQCTYIILKAHRTTTPFHWEHINKHRKPKSFWSPKQKWKKKNDRVTNDMAPRWWIRFLLIPAVPRGAFGKPTMNLNIQYIFTVENINKLTEKVRKKTTTNNPRRAGIIHRWRLHYRNAAKRFYFVFKSHLIRRKV